MPETKLFEFHKEPNFLSASGTNSFGFVLLKREIFTSTFQRVKIATVDRRNKNSKNLWNFMKM